MEIVGCRDMIIEITGYSMINKTGALSVPKIYFDKRGLSVYAKGRNKV